MFTGIITHIGVFQKRSKNTLFFSATADFVSSLKNGNSIAINGVCVTITNTKKAEFSVEIMPETVKKTMFGLLVPGTKVNLERSLGSQGRFEGHMVQGHVEGVATVIDIKKQDEASWLFLFKTSPELLRYIVPKGSIAIHGVSLTVIECGNGQFSVGIIPYTFEHTNFSQLHISDLVHIETDIFARYIGKFLKGGAYEKCNNCNCNS